MKLLTIKIRNEKYSFAIDKCKSIIGDHFYNICNALKSFFNKCSLSEYSKENGYELNVYLDNKIIDLKCYNLIVFDANYDLLNEYKLTQKSLLYKVIECYLKKQEYKEEIQTINILLKDFLLEIEQEFNDKNIPLVLDDFEIDIKTVLANVTVGILKDEMLSNQNDYDFITLSRLKENIVKYLIENSIQNQFIILDEIGLIKKEDFMNHKNVLIITKKLFDCSLTNIYDSKNDIDYADEEKLYSIFLESGKNADFQAFKVELEKELLK